MKKDESERKTVWKKVVVPRSKQKLQLITGAPNMHINIIINKQKKNTFFDFKLKVLDTKVI
jgi:hypothetical protein